MSTPTLYTHLALARLLDVSVTTIKSYRRKFPGCIPVANQGKPIRFGQDAYDVCLRIRDLFATGMSVADVRRNLAEEFAWISPETPEEPKENRAEAPALPPLYASAMSDMAQNLVGLAQKQGTVLSRLEELGEVISSAPVTGVPGPAPLPAAAGVSGNGAATAPPSTERPDWLDEFSGLADRLGDTIIRLEDTINRLNEWVRSLAAQLSAQAVSQAVTQTVAQTVAQTGGADNAHQTGTAPGAMPNTAPGSNPMGENPAQRQPARAFMTLPLVITGDDGLLHGIAGPGRGRFTCADIKAMAACVSAPERACTLEWEEAGTDWLLTVRGMQENMPLASALLREVADSVGNTAVLLHQVRIGDEMRGPTDFFIFLRDRM